MSKTNSEKIDKVFIEFFILSRFRVFLSNGGLKALKKTFCKNNRVEKFLQNIRPKIQNRFFSRYFHHVFGRFSVRGVQKHDVNKISKKKSDPGPFLASDPPTHHGGHRNLLAAPCRTYRRIEKKKNTAVLTAHRKHKLRRPTAGFNREQAKKPKHRQRPGQTPSHLTTANFQLPATTTTQGRIFLPLEGRQKRASRHCFYLFLLALFLAFLERPCQKKLPKKALKTKNTSLFGLFSSPFPPCVLGRFSERGVKKHHRSIEKKSRSGVKNDRPSSILH
jgi:hypothetical protein